MERLRMRLHVNAVLTINQRREVKRLHKQEGMSIKAVAERLRVHETMIRR